MRIARPATSRRRSRRSAIDQLRITAFQTLLGATGTGKTATMAWTIEKVGKPALIIAHNKTLAAQLCNEFREFFPENSVEYFVSYYDYYQPEAYVPQADLYIEKDSSQNDDISRLRLAATSSLMTRRDVVIVASVSCIYGLGSPEEWKERVLILEVGETHDRDAALRKLIESQYVRNDSVLGRGRFRVKGDVMEVQPANAETAHRISFFGDDVESITHFDPLTGRSVGAAREPRHLAGHRVRHVDAVHRAGRRRHPRRARGAGGEVRRRGEDARGAPSQAADGVRPRDAEGARLLLGHRELLAPPRGPAGGVAPVHAHRLLPRRLHRLRGRVAPDDPADRGHVGGRPVAQADARRLRLPAAVRDRQPAAALRRVPRQGAAARLRVGDARGVRAPQLGGGRRAADPADVRRRSRGRGAADEEPDRRPPQRDPATRGGERARARHDADEEDGRGPHGLPAGGRASARGTSTRRSTRSSASRSSASCGSASTTCSSA